jgi:hypothetical protein
MRKQHGLESPRIVCNFTDRPKELNDYYRQAILMLQYYNDTKVLIERNRYRMISYFDDNDAKYLLQHAPQGIMRLVGGKVNTIGINMTAAAKDYLIDLIEEYIDDFSEEIPDVELLDEFIAFGTRNTDKAMAFGLTLIQLKEDKMKTRKRSSDTITLPRVKHVMDAQGRITKVIS